MKAVLYVASSLNGKMTDGPHDSGWVAAEDEKMFAQVCADIGAILVGRTTFDQYQGTVYPVPHTANIVLTSHPENPSSPNVHYVSDLEQVQSKLAELGYERFVVVGGANVIAQCLQAKFIETIYLSLHPYIFSDGLNMIGDFRGSLELTYKGIKHESSNFLLLEYQIK